MTGPMQNSPQTTSTPARRRFTLADVMIVVAAAAFGLMLERVLLTNMSPFGALEARLWTRKAFLQASPFLIVASPALLALRMRQPRPSPRRLFRQPGTVACLVVAADVLIHGLFLIARTFLGSITASSFHFGTEFYFFSTLYSGRSIAVAWALMGLTSIWRPEANWIDRAGRTFGVVMIIVWVLSGLNL